MTVFGVAYKDLTKKSDSGRRLVDKGHDWMNIQIVCYQMEATERSRKVALKILLEITITTRRDGKFCDDVVRTTGDKFL
jgi:hypothetical protein